MIPMKLFSRRMLSAMTALIAVASLHAEVPRLVHYQGKLRDAAGVAVNDTVSLRFRLYGHATQASPELLDETHGSVAVTNGLFNVLIGAATVGGVPDSAVDRPDVYIGIVVNGGDELTPRTRLVSTAYAVSALSAEQLVRPGSLQPAVQVDLNGNVGVGTGSPGEKLEVAGSLKAAAITGLTTPLSLGQGGTGAGLAASNGGVVYSTGSALDILSGTATAGQILRSGASSTPAWSAATYPGAAGATGNVLTSDGTNWVSAAMPSSGVNVYKSDNTTLLGPLVGATGTSCTTWVYWTGSALQPITSDHCPSSVEIHYSNTDCTGTMWTQSVVSGTKVCDGFHCGQVGGSVSGQTERSRGLNGACSPINSGLNGNIVNPIATPLCGLGPCRVH